MVVGRLDGDLRELLRPCAGQGIRACRSSLLECRRGLLDLLDDELCRAFLEGVSFVQVDVSAGLLVCEVGEDVC